MTADSCSVCLLGNSHLAAYKLAWTAGIRSGPPDGIRVTFFGVPAVRFHSLTLENGALVPSTDAVRHFLSVTSGGEEKIDLAKYDVFALVGTGVYFHKLLNAFTMDDSPDHIREQLCGRVEGSIKRILQIRAASNAPIICCPKPFASEQIMRRTEFRHYRDPAYAKYLASLLEIFREVSDSVVARHGASIIWQDNITMRIPGFTRSEFSVGSIRLSTGEPHPDRDSIHMNPEYGALMLFQLLQRLRGLRAAGELKQRGSS